MPAPYRRWDISPSAFADIVRSVAADASPQIVEACVDAGWGLWLTIRSKSGKTEWQAVCDFDPRTGEAQCAVPYRTSAIFRDFRREVMRRIREAPDVDPRK